MGRCVGQKRELIKTFTFDNLLRSEVQELVGALEVTCWAKADGLDCSVLHGVGLILVGFVIGDTVGSKLGPAMRSNIEIPSEDDFTG